MTAGCAQWRGRADTRYISSNRSLATTLLAPRPGVSPTSAGGHFRPGTRVRWSSGTNDHWYSTRWSRYRMLHRRFETLVGAERSPSVEIKVIVITFCSIPRLVCRSWNGCSDVEGLSRATIRAAKLSCSLNSHNNRQILFLTRCVRIAKTASASSRCRCVNGLGITSGGPQLGESKEARKRRSHDHSSRLQSQRADDKISHNRAVMTSRGAVRVEAHALGELRNPNRVSSALRLGYDNEGIAPLLRSHYGVSRAVRNR